MPSVNNYFDNKVTSIAFQTATKPATVGEANQKFQVKVDVETAYLCVYGK